MIKLTLKYNLDSGTFFDMDYFLGPHMDISAQVWEGKGLLNVGVEKPMEGNEVIAHLTFESMECLEKLSKQERRVLEEDVAKYTDASPETMLSTVLFSEKK